MNNTFVWLTEEKSLKVVVVGNSVTAGAPAGSQAGGTPSFYVTLERWLNEKFPDARIEVIPRIIYAIGPEVQVFRMDERVISGHPDLVIVEFGAANGAWGDAGKSVTEPATEGFVRRLREKLPETDCVMMMGIFKTMLEDYRRGKTPGSVTFQRDVASRYHCALADAQQEIANRVLGGEDWESYMKDSIHPGSEGYRVYGQILVDKFEREFEKFRQGSVREIRPHRLPSETLHADPWCFPRLVPPSEAGSLDGFELRKNGDVEYLASTKPGASGRLAVAPPARIVGILMRESGSPGNLEVEASGKWVRLPQKSEPHFTTGEDRNNRFYRNFFATCGLPPDLNEVRFRLSAEPEVRDGQDVGIAGFFVIEKPFLPDAGAKGIVPGS